MIRRIVVFMVKHTAGLDRTRRLLNRLGEIPQALAAWRAHPTYAKTTAKTTRAVRPLRELRWSADFRSALS